MKRSVGTLRGQRMWELTSCFINRPSKSSNRKVLERYQVFDDAAARSGAVLTGEASCCASTGLCMQAEVVIIFYQRKNNVLIERVVHQPIDRQLRSLVQVNGLTGQAHFFVSAAAEAAVLVRTSN